MAAPFLVIHAALFWKVVLGAFVAVGTGSFLIVRRLLADRAMRARVRALDGSKDPGVIRGVLGGGGAATLHTMSTYSVAGAYRQCAPELWIETADGRVELHGEITVIAGTRAVANRRIPRAAPASLATAAQPVAPTRLAYASLLEIGPGDEVIARGTLGQEAGTEATDYRANAAQLTLTGPVELAAARWRRAQPRPSWFALGVIAGALGFGGYKIEQAIGEAFLDRCGTDGDVQISNGNACVIANAMPTGRRPLVHLLSELDQHAVTSTDELEQRLALARLVEDCPRVLQRVERLGHPDFAIAEARRCGDRSAEELALVESGRFEEAVALDAPLDDYHTGIRPLLYALAHRWQTAASYLKHRTTLRNPESDPDRRAADEAREVSVHCISALFSFYADGNAASVARIHELAAGPHGEECAPELVEVGTPAERAAALANSKVSSRALDLERQLTGSGPVHGMGAADALLQGADGISHLYGPALWATELAAVLPATAEAEARFTDAAHRLVLQVLLGNLPAAHGFADVAVPLASDSHAHYSYDAQFVVLFHPMIDLYSPETKWRVPQGPTDDGPFAHLFGYLVPRLALRHGDPIPADSPIYAGVRRTALEAAMRGDATQLVAAVHDHEQVTPLDLIAVLPRITAQRAELVAILPWMRSDDQLDAYRFPFGVVQRLAERRTMFALAGDRASTATATATFQRYATALHDRRVLIALSLLDPF